MSPEDRAREDALVGALRAVLRESRALADRCHDVENLDVWRFRVVAITGEAERDAERLASTPAPDRRVVVPQVRDG